MFFAVVLGLPAGVIAAVNREEFYDRVDSLIGYSMPIFRGELAADHIVFSEICGGRPCL
jgi:dipeptide transport system permease protein